MQDIRGGVYGSKCVLKHSCCWVASSGGIVDSMISPVAKFLHLQTTGPSMFPTLNTRGDRPWLPFSVPFLNFSGDLLVLEHFSVFAKTIKVGEVEPRTLCIMRLFTCGTTISSYRGCGDLA